MAAPTSIWSRKSDLCYLIFFFIHVPIMLAVDLTPLYPASLTPTPLLNLRAWYAATYQDRFFITPPTWFKSFLVLEAVYHIPLSLWAVGAILRDDPLVPPNLLVWAVQTFITTMTCCVDVWSWEGVTQEVKVGVLGLYAPYCALAAVVGLDMFFRLKAKLVSPALDEGKKKA